MVDLSNVKVGDILINRNTEQVAVCHIYTDRDGRYPIIVSKLSTKDRYSVTLNGFFSTSNGIHSYDIVEIIGSKEIEFKPLVPTEDDTKQFWDAMIGMATREEFLGYCKLNVIRYVSRYNKKNGVADLKKAVTYCERMIRFLKEEKGQ